MTLIRKVPRPLGWFVLGIVMALLSVAIPAWALSCNNCVNGGDLVDGSVRAADIATGGVGGAEIIDGSVRARDIGALPAARVRHVGTQNIGSGDQTQLMFNTEVFDTGGVHSGTYPERLIAPRTGIYAIGWNILVDNADADGYRQLSLYVNGSTVEVTDRVYPPAGAAFVVLDGSTLLHLSAGDFVRLDLFQLSGSTLAVYGDSPGYPVFWMHWVSG